MSDMWELLEFEESVMTALPALECLEKAPDLKDQRRWVVMFSTITKSYLSRVLRGLWTIAFMVVVASEKLADFSSTSILPPRAVSLEGAEKPVAYMSQAAILELARSIMIMSEFGMSVPKPIAQKPSISHYVRVTVKWNSIEVELGYRQPSLNLESSSTSDKSLAACAVRINNRIWVSIFFQQGFHWLVGEGFGVLKGRGFGR